MWDVSRLLLISYFSHFCPRFIDTLSRSFCPFDHRSFHTQIVILPVRYMPLWPLMECPKISPEATISTASHLPTAQLSLTATISWRAATVGQKPPATTVTPSTSCPATSTSWSSSAVQLIVYSMNPWSAWRNGSRIELSWKELICNWEPEITFILLFDCLKVTLSYFSVTVRRITCAKWGNLN